MADDQRCGGCRWFVIDDADSQSGMGECIWRREPLPSCMVHIPVHEEDDDCPCFERKEASDASDAR